MSRALVRFYRRWLTRWTPECALEPSCSAFALEYGVRAAWRRQRAEEGVRCGDRYLSESARPSA